ncbi:lipoprotein releasing system ATP-binding protein lolD [Alcanivorax balearicus MACL04]|uniref:Lipoprotein releasing system ATP-binding protein lolD n=1 Tax=Alloalcanivorax balearicus MACL04 TaxID=1177182 RepID=A0ABT2QYE7_9GAMM|nr:ATP-binding cassette domain-containing protein [Alloalcanivorax balearicus]MCU5782544.1 lipoprotein releasing system ATP-binding protein lolD [Alloalcanivorax balearicus MACL04]
MNDTVLHARGLIKSYQEGHGELQVLSGVELHVRRGDMAAIIGASGSGKSTLLNLLGGLDVPTRGSVTIGGQPLAGMNERALGQIRNRYLGFVYQFHHLLPEFTALENVAMPLLIRGELPKHASERAERILSRVGLGERLQHKPSMLSGGERQRVAIARALVTDPALVMADEPTGNLDERTAAQVQDLMLELNQTLGTAFLLVTHAPEFARRCHTRHELHDGLLRPLD